MPARILYVGQQVAISPYNTGVSITRYLPVQSASCEVTRPIEDILSFGRLGSLGRIQNSVSTCRADIKTYLPLSTGVGLIDDSSRTNILDTLLIQTLTGEALNGQVSTIAVTPNGFYMSGILTNIGVEISNGAFATASLSFAGVGEPTFSSAPTGVGFTQQTNMPATFTPVVSNYVSGAVNTGCANSFRFSLDLPNETISCLGGKTSGTQQQALPVA